MKKITTAILAATTVLTAISNKEKVTAKTILESHNELATLLKLDTVTKFANKEKGVAALTAIVATAEAKDKPTEKKDDKKKPELKEDDKKEKVAKVGRVGLLVTTFSKADEKADEVAATPIKMSDVKISTFKNATKIELSRIPSEPQRLWLVKLGCWEKTSVVEPTAAS